MPAEVDPVQNAAVNPQYVCEATIRRSQPISMRASENMLQLTICTLHIPELAHSDAVSIADARSSPNTGRYRAISHD